MTTQVLIQLRNLSVTYPNGQIALEGVNIDLLPGHVYGLVGINGSGKSTLFKTMTGFVKPTAGQALIGGQGIRAALKKNMVSYVPQSEDVDWNFPVLVEDVVMMGRYGHMGWLRIPGEADREAVSRALAQVDLAEMRRRQIGELSGGQKKRVFLARALAQESRIILLDEPFTGVDVKTENTIIELLRTLKMQGCLILVSTHNLGSVPAFCDDVILINRRILAAGPVETTFTQENLTQAFGGMLRFHQIEGTDLHDDEDPRGVTVLTDDERPLVFYGKTTAQQIVPNRPEDHAAAQKQGPGKRSKKAAKKDHPSD